MHIVNVRPEEIFQALADPTRLRIVRLLTAAQTEACLCELAHALDEPQCNVSRHLKVLRHAGLLAAEREGRFVYHTLVSGPVHLERLSAMVHGLPDPGTFGGDLKRFKECVKSRRHGRCRGAPIAPARSLATAKR